MSGSGKEVLVLGAGMVVRPLVPYLTQHGYRVVVASRTLAKAQQIVEGISGAKAVECDVETDAGKATLETLLPSADAVVSLLPYLLHPFLAKRALAHNKHFFTTSYVSPAMRELDEEAKAKNLVFINECGVDPGTDHMSAMQIIDDVKSKGGKILLFTSYCGGLPAPDSNNNPLGYKFSWSARGVLLASTNNAIFLQDGEKKEIAGKDLFDSFHLDYIPELSAEYETYPNRNSLQYIDVYGISTTQTMIRGTYRNKGWCPTVKKLGADLGFLDLTERNFQGVTYAQALREMINSTAADKESLKSDVRAFLKLDADKEFVISTADWLGLFDEEPIPAKIKTRLDALCHKMESKMQYNAGERDMLLMKHTFIAEYPDGKKEKITCKLIDYGIPNGDSSMARTVSLPVAISIRLVLEGKFTTPGLQIPIIKELYEPILQELEALEPSIKFVHQRETL
jgi:saccharopine dehydrogenase (NADP+, L-glutamate forming)